jgi:hypothetical protein
MKSSVPATNHRQQRGKVNDLLTPQMQRRLRGLTSGLEQCSHPLFNHLGSLNIIFEALNTARQSADCLLMDDPFEAWKQLMGNDEWDDLREASTTETQIAHTTTAPSVTRIITRPMRQQLVEAVTRLDEYHTCLVAVLNDLTKLESFNSAWELAEHLQSDRPLETAESCKKREKVEAEQYFDLFEAL